MTGIIAVCAKCQTTIVGDIKSAEALPEGWHVVADGVCCPKCLGIEQKPKLWFSWTDMNVGDCICGYNMDRESHNHYRCPNCKRLWEVRTEICEITQ